MLNTIIISAIIPCKLQSHTIGKPNTNIPPPKPHSETPVTIIIINTTLINSIIFSFLSPHFLYLLYNFYNNLSIVLGKKY